MPSSFKHNYFAFAALVAAALFAVIEVSGPMMAKTADLNNPLGMLSHHIASLFSPAPSLLRAGTDRIELARHVYAGFSSVLLVLFIALLFMRLRSSASDSRARNDGLIIAQLLIGITIDSVLLNLLVAAQLATLMPLRRGLAWLAFQVLFGLAADVVLIIKLIRHDGLALNILFQVTLERLAQTLGFGIALIVGLERRTRLTLAASNAELLATQGLLGDMVRASERMRIARDLHDVVGHHLTALNLHLDLALRQTEGTANPALATSRALARDMLAEVRTMVDAERRDQPINLREALHTLCSGIPAPAIRLHYADQLEIHSAAAAHALFCCVQEAITNAVRHSGAEILTIDIRQSGGEIVVAIADNGRGSGGRAEGNGLRGMRERIVQLGGAVTAGNLPVRGFGLELCLPAAGAAP